MALPLKMAEPGFPPRNLPRTSGNPSHGKDWQFPCEEDTQRGTTFSLL